MSTVAPMIGVIVRADRGSPPPWAALAPCTAADALAAGILLIGAHLPPLESLGLAVLHGTAVLLLWEELAGVPPSRRFLCVAALLAVPFVGAAVALATLVTRGRGSTALDLGRGARRRGALTAAAIQHLADALSPWDALECGNEEERRAALIRLSRQRDPEAIALLRRAAAGRDPNLALSAALALDEIGERAEREAGRPDPVEVRYEAV